MLAVALVGADRPVLSWDEVTTADVSQRSPAQIWHTITNIDAVLGAYYFMMHGWIALAGTSELALRLPSILAMAGAVAVAGELARRLFGPLVGTVTGLILCILPNTSRYAAEARPYAFTCLLSVLSLLLLYRAVGMRGRLRWPAYGVSVLLLGLSHLIALTTLCAHAAVVLVRRRDERSWRTTAGWGATVAVALVALLPLAWLGSHQQDTQLAWVDPLTLGGLWSAPRGVVGSRDTAWILVGLALLVAWRPVHPVVHLTVLALGPPAVLALMSVVSSPVWVYRYLLVVLAPLAMLAAVAVAGRDGPPAGAGRRWWAVAVRSAVVLVVLACSAYPGQRAVRGATAKNGPDYRAIAQVLRRHQAPGDAVVYQARSRALRAGMEYYLSRGQAAPRDVLRSRPAADVGRLMAEEHPDAAARLAGVDRVWVVIGDTRRDPLTGQPAVRPLLRDRYERIGLWRLNRATVGLYRARS
jgi:mannosyltransferase